MHCATVAPKQASVLQTYVVRGTPSATKLCHANTTSCRLVSPLAQAYAAGSCKQKARVLRRPLAVIVVSISQARRHGQSSRDTRNRRCGGRCAEST